MLNEIFNISITYCLLALLAVTGPLSLHPQGNTNEVSGPKMVAHSIELMHPGLSLTEKVACTLFEVLDDEGLSSTFLMDVATVVCGDAQCRIDTVRIHWTSLGHYHRLTLPQGVELEKAEGLRFDQEDYEKLDSILANRDGSLKHVYKEEVVGTESSDGIDAITGATIILNNKDYVAGAVWTCYTLWHWANGDIYFIIRNIAAGHLDTPGLLKYLQKDSMAHQVFASEQFIQRRIYDSKVIEAMKENVAANNYQLTKLTIEYIEDAPLQVYLETLLEWLKNNQPEQRSLFLTSLLEHKTQVSNSFFESLASLASTWQDYPSIHLILTTLERKNASSPAIRQAVSNLLEHQNFIIARRAYWFLNDQELTASMEQKLKLFYQQHADKL